MRPLHVYVHFPWCEKKCPYCDFVVVDMGVRARDPQRSSAFRDASSRAGTRAQEGRGRDFGTNAIDHDGYADAVIAELAARAVFFRREHAVSTIFFGGGTPSLWSATAIARVIEAIRNAFAPSTGDREVTVECNPSSLAIEHARALVGAGVTRLSIGVQSLDDRLLNHLGRDHDAASARRCVADAVKSGARVSADLIFGLPGQSPGDAAAHACELVDLGAEHVSAYALTIEAGTPFFELARRGRLPIADDDETCDSFVAIDEALTGRGLRHYEVSNYARPRCESRHNLGYWNGSAYLGLGCGAYGFALVEKGSGFRYRNEVDVRRYVHSARTIAPGAPSLGDGVTRSLEPLDAQTLLRERIMLGMRLEEGLDLDLAAAELGLAKVDVWTPARLATLRRLAREGGLAVERSRLTIPRERRLSTDGIASALF